MSALAGLLRASAVRSAKAPAGGLQRCLGPSSSLPAAALVGRSKEPQPGPQTQCGGQAGGSPWPAGWCSRGCATLTSSVEVGESYWADVLNSVSDVGGRVSTADEMSALATFQVLEVQSNGSLIQTSHTPKSLGLHSRDVSLFTSKRTHAAISPRDGSVLFINDFVRAIIMADKVAIFPCRRKRHMVSVAEAVSGRLGTTTATGLSFEISMLEALLSSSVAHFYQRARHLALLVNIVTRNSEAFASPDFQPLLPLQQSISETHQDVTELQEATSEVLRDDKTVASLFLCGSRHPEEVEEKERQIASLLSSYQLQIQVIEGMIEEMQEQLTNTRDISRMQMSSKRNYIIQTNMVISIANLALLNCTIVAGFFGMNLTSGLEEIPYLFPAVVCGAMGLSLAAFTGIYGFVAWRPRRTAEENIRQVSAIRSLMVNHIDDIGDIVSYHWEHYRDRAATRSQFHMMAWEVTKRRSKPMSQGEVDMLFDFFDFDRTGKVEVEEMAAIYEKLSEQTTLTNQPGIPSLVELLHQKKVGKQNSAGAGKHQNLQLHEDYY